MLLDSGVPLLLRFFENFQADGIRLPGSLAIVAGGLIMQIYLIYPGKGSARNAQEYFEFAAAENRVRHHAAYRGVPQTVKVEFKANRKERARSRGASLAMLGAGVFLLGAGILALSAGGRKEVAGSGSKTFSSAWNAISDKLRKRS